MDVRLPPEIWRISARYISKWDLSSLSQSSRYLFRVIRPLLFKELKLIRTSFEANKNLILLLENKNLAECIRSFSITNFPLRTGSFDSYQLTQLVRSQPFPLADVLLKMTALTSLRLNGFAFSSSDEQQRFVEGFESRVSPLQELQYSARNQQLQEDDKPFPSEELGLSRLIYISWDCNLGCKYHFLEKSLNRLTMT
jgi:hypothetical protein